MAKLYLNSSSKRYLDLIRALIFWCVFICASSGVMAKVLRHDAPFVKLLL